MVTANVVLDLALMLTIVVLLMIPRMVVGRMETLAHYKPRRVGVRSMRRHAWLLHVKHAA